ncbi:TPA: integrase core domain-containing protein [Escherichia coli]
MATQRQTPATAKKASSTQSRLQNAGDYISIMPKPDGLTAAKNLAEAFEHYNEWHPHSALGYRSPREYLRQWASDGLSDNRCLEI